MTTSQNTTSLDLVSSTSFLPAEFQEMEEYMGSAHSKSTDRSYGDAWAEFTDWAQPKGYPTLPAQPMVIGKFLTHLANRLHNKPATLSIKLAAIAYKHREAGQPDPTKNVVIQKVMTNIRRKYGSKPSKKAPITFEALQVMVGKLDASTLAGKRDRALILLGFAGAFRRSELVALDVEDLHINGDLKVTLKRSKTDQEGRGMMKVIPHISGSDIDPITALLDWLDTAEIRSGPIFRQIDRWGNARPDRLTPQSVALIIKAAASGAGLDTRQFAGHSVRSGFITSAVVAGMSLNDIAEVSGHKSLDVLRGYVQDAGAGGRRAILKVFGGDDDQ